MRVHGLCELCKPPNTSWKGSREIACPGCLRTRKHYARGLCKGCYSKAVPRPSVVCSSCGETREGQAKGMCKPCYLNAWENDPVNRPAVLVRKRATARRTRLRSYGLTVAQEDALLLASQGKCETCGDTFAEKRRTPDKQGHAIDHCHVTGKVRGLLCHNCNVAIGLVQERPTVLEALASYLRKHSA